MIKRITKTDGRREFPPHLYEPLPERRPAQEKFTVIRGHRSPRCRIGFTQPFPWDRLDALKIPITPHHSMDYWPSLDALFHQAAEQVGNEIVMDRHIYGGAPCVAGTRVPVYAILELLEAGWSLKKIASKKGFPITPKQLAASLRFAAIVMER